MAFLELASSRLCFLAESGVAADFSSDGSTAVVVGGLLRGSLIDTRSWQVIQEFSLMDPTLPEGVRACALGREAKTIADVLPGHLCHYDLATSSLLGLIEGHGDVIESARFAAGGAQVLTCSRDATCKLWNLPTAVPTGRRGGRLHRHVEDRFWETASPSRPVRSCCVAHNGSVVLVSRRTGHAIGGSDSVLESDCLPAGGMIRAVSVDNASSLAAGRSIFVAGFPTGHMHIGRYDDNAQVAVRSGHREEVTGCAISYDDAFAASVSTDRDLRIFDATTGTPRRRVKNAHRAPARGCAFSPDGARLATCGDDGRVQVWAVNEGGLLDAWRVAGSAGLLTCAFAPDGESVLAGASDGTLWVFRPGEPCRSVPAVERDAILSCAWLSDAVVASVTRSGLLLLQRLPTGATLARAVFSTQVSAAHVNGLERYFLVGTSDEGLHLFTIDQWVEPS